MFGQNFSDKKKKITRQFADSPKFRGGAICPCHEAGAMFR